MLSSILLPHLKIFRLNLISKELGVPLLNHHRAVDDAEATAHIFLKFLDMLQKKGANTVPTPASPNVNAVARHITNSIESVI